MMRRQGRLAGLLIAAGLALCLIGGAVYTVQAQSAGIVVVIARPGEGETIYAGPQTFLYSIAVTGRVAIASGDLQAVQIKLEIFDKTGVIGTRTDQAGADGRFSLPVTVNPGRSADELLSGSTLDRNSGCLTACHHATDVSLKAGYLLLRVTATDPSGRQASDQRHIIVDHAGYATIPVQLELDGSGQSAEGIPITAAARVYLVRARYIKAATDANGRATLNVEALAEAPTRYVFQVEPTVVNGVLYQSVAPVEMDLPAGATSAPTVRLTITAQSGQIAGRLSQSVAGMDTGAPLTVRAIRLRDGTSYLATVTPDGQFAFSKLSIDQYLIALDKTALAPQGLTSRDLNIDLSKTVSATVELPLVPLKGASLRGTVRDAQGAALPFAWLSIDRAGVNGRVLPASGEFLLTNLPSEASSITVTAPGYFSQTQAIDLSAKTPQTLDLALARRPETRSLNWGDGQVIIPPESEVKVENGQVTLTRGWLWGQSNESQRLEIQVGDTTIVITKGKFALEQLSGPPGWFFLLDGEASITQGSASLTVGKGQMLALKNTAHLAAAPLDPIVVAALQVAAPAPFSPVWEMTLGARIRDGLGQMGIGAAQAVTFATYLLGMLLACLVPLISSIWWLRKRARARSLGV